MLTLESNRVSRAIDNLRAKTPTIDADALAKLDSAMAIDSGEHFAFQEAQAHAHASGVLTTDEALIVYNALGEVGSDANGGWAAGTDLETKVVVTKLVGDLLARRS